MALSLNHQFVSAKPDDTDASLINPSNWNAGHKIPGSGIMEGKADPLNELLFHSATQGHQVLRSNAGNTAFEFATPSYRSSSDFNFTPQFSPESISAGISNTITLSPVPNGVNGSDVGHYLYLNDDAGSEAVLITGGTAVSGASSGTIVFTPVSSHTTGEYSVSSATAGIQEALQFQNAAYVPPGTFNVYAKISLKSGNLLSGAGRGISILNFLMPASYNGSAIDAVGSIGSADPVTADLNFSRWRTFGTSITVVDSSSYADGQLILLRGSSEVTLTKTLSQICRVRTQSLGVITPYDSVFIPMLTAAADHHVYKLTPVSGVRVEHLTISGENSSCTMLRGLIFYYGDNCHVFDVATRGFNAAGIYLLCCFASSTDATETFECGSESESDTFFVGCTHCNTDRISAFNVNAFGPQWSQCLFVNANNIRISHVTAGRGMKVQATGWSNFNNISLSNTIDVGVRGTLGVVYSSWNNNFTNVLLNNMNFEYGSLWIGGDDEYQNKFTNVVINGNSTYSVCMNGVGKYNSIHNLSTGWATGKMRIYFEATTSDNFISVSGDQASPNVYDNAPTNRNVVEYLNPRWVEPTLQNSWVNYGGSYENVAYKVISNKRIALKGTAKSGASPLIFDLPSNGSYGYLASPGIRQYKIKSVSDAAHVEHNGTGIYIVSADATKCSLDGIILEL